MNKAKSGLARKAKKKKLKKKKTLWVLIQRKKIYNKPVLYPQPEYCLEFSTFVWSPRSFSLLSSFTALVERGELQRVVPGKQKHGAKVAVGLRLRLNKASTLSRPPPTIPGSPAQHTAALRLSLAGHQSSRAFCSTPAL